MTKDMLSGKKWNRYVGKDLETHSLTRELGWGKRRVAEINLSKRNVPFTGIKYFVSGGVAEMRPIGLSKDLVSTKMLRHKFQSFRKYNTAKKNVTKLKKEYRKVI